MTNFRHALKELTDTLMAYQVAIGKMQTENVDAQSKAVEAHSGVARSALDVLNSGNFLGRSTVDAKVLAFDVQSGALNIDAAVVNSAIASVDARISAVGDARKSMDAAWKVLSAYLDSSSTEATKAKASLQAMLPPPPSGGNSGGNKPTDGKPTDGKPSDGKPADSKPTDGKSGDGKAAPKKGFFS